MKTRPVWLLTTLLVVAGLVLTSCGTTATTTTPGATTTAQPTATTTKPPATTTSAPTAPAYGGTLTTALPAGYTNFDLMTGTDISMIWVQATHNEPIGGDFAKGPAGTKQTEYQWGAIGVPELLIGEIAESWTIPDGTTIVWNIRKGVKFAKNPKAEKNALVNGREMVAADWVWSIDQAFNNPLNWQARQYPAGDRGDQLRGKRSTSIPSKSKCPQSRRV